MNNKLIIIAVIAQIVLGMGAEGGCGAGVRPQNNNNLDVPPRNVSDEDPADPNGSGGGKSRNGGLGHKNPGNPQGQQPVNGPANGNPQPVVVQQPVNQPVVVQQPINQPIVVQPPIQPLNAQPIVNQLPQVQVQQVNIPGVNAMGFNVAGEDVLGLNTIAANQHRENRVQALLQSLSNRGYGLIKDVIMMEDHDDLASLRIAINNGQINPVSDKDIYNDLRRFEGHITRWVTGGHRIRAFNQLGNNVPLEHVPEMVRKPGKFLDYVQLWNALGVNNDFYMTIYNELNTVPLLGQADFPDIADVALNGNGQVQVDTKRDYLILALGSIKNKNDNRTLDVGVVSRIQNHQNLYPTGGNRDSWFAELRYKLYHIAQVVGALDNNSKATLLSELLNAGKHCSDAKSGNVENALRLFNLAVYQNLELMKYNLATNLQERMEMVASTKKSNTLTSAINATLHMVEVAGNWRVIHETKDMQRPFDDLVIDFTIQNVRDESITFKAGTWDAYAKALGLKKKKVQNPDMKLVIDMNAQIFGQGAYNPRALFNEIRRDLKIEIMETYAGSLVNNNIVDNHSDYVITGALIDHGFLRNR